MQKAYFFSSLMTIFSFCGCVQNQGVSQQSASISISKEHPLDNVKGAIIDVYFSDGWDLEDESGSRLQFIKNDDRILVQALAGSHYDTAVWHRETVTISSSTEFYRLMARQTIISNRGSAFERVTPCTTNASIRFNSVFNRLKANAPRKVDSFSDDFATSNETSDELDLSDISKAIKSAEDFSSDLDHQDKITSSSKLNFSVGMSKGDVFEISGRPNLLEGYEWGSVWFFKDSPTTFLPVVFDGNDLVIGVGSAFYKQSLKDLGKK